MTDFWISDAVEGEGGRYRYVLTRQWGEDLGAKVLWIMLNPSKADAIKPDPTMTRCVGFAKSWGYDGITLTNLYAYRATDPVDLVRNGRPVGPKNDRHLREQIELHDLIVCAWGTKAGKSRASEVVKMILDAGKKPQAIAITKGGFPQHPLMARATLRPFVWVRKGTQEAAE